MKILLPPSETKLPGGSGSPNPAALSFARELGDARARVRAALEALSRDEEAAASALKLGKKNRGELEHNLVLGTSRTLPAIERYTGVLYDALAVHSMGERERAWVDAPVCVQSALFGLVGAADRIPAYRLSGGSRLPALGVSLKRVWRDAHSAIDWSAWSGGGLVLDLRSKDYAALADVPGAVPLHVAQRGPGGEVRALNHFNKAAKGDLVRRLARSLARDESERIGSVDDLLSWAGAEEIEMFQGEQLTVVVARE